MTTENNTPTTSLATATGTNPDDGPMTAEAAARMLGADSMAMVHVVRNEAVADLIQRQSERIATLEAMLVDLYDKACDYECADMLHLLYPDGSHASPHFPAIRALLDATDRYDERSASTL